MRTRSSPNRIPPPSSTLTLRSSERWLPDSRRTPKASPQGLVPVPRSASLERFQSPKATLSSPGRSGGPQVCSHGVERRSPEATERNPWKAAPARTRPGGAEDDACDPWATAPPPLQRRCVRITHVVPRSASLERPSVAEGDALRPSRAHECCRRRNDIAKRRPPPKGEPRARARGTASSHVHAPRYLDRSARRAHDLCQRRSDVAKRRASRRYSPPRSASFERPPVAEGDRASHRDSPPRSTSFKRLKVAEGD
jgi:hypothetical protein